MGGLSRVVAARPPAVAAVACGRPRDARPVSTTGAGCFRPRNLLLRPGGSGPPRRPPDVVSFSVPCPAAWPPIIEGNGGQSRPPRRPRSHRCNPADTEEVVARGSCSSDAGRSSPRARPPARRSARGRGARAGSAAARSSRSAAGRGQQGGARPPRHARDRQALRRVARRGPGDRRHRATSSSARAGACTARPSRARCPTSSSSRSACPSASPRSSPRQLPGRVPSWYLVPALLCGNAVVWKPAEYAPAIGGRWPSSSSTAACPTAC
jgi:hypothetical protein